MRIEERVVESGTAKFSGFSQGKTSSWAMIETSPGTDRPSSLSARMTPSDMIRLEQTSAVGRSRLPMRLWVER